MSFDRVARRRGALMDAHFPIAGDILFYQARGEQICGFIRDRIREVQAPVFLLAHSLGGIACVDLLAREAVPEVALLATVGSQAPFLYEVDALRSLPFGMPLPEHFPRWINFFDRRDLLSFVGTGVFPGRVLDVEVSSRFGFPMSHSAYWGIATLWETLTRELHDGA
jgi:hypothetical protein